MVKHKLIVSIDKELYNKLDKLRTDIGLPISKIVELSLEGYTIEQIKQKYKIKKVK